MAPSRPTSAPEQVPAAASGCARAEPATLAPLLSVVVLAGLAVWGLARRSFWVDEAITVGATNELVPTLRGTGGTMGLYYLLVTPWSWVSTDRFWLRSLSVLLAVAAMPVIWSVARRAFGRRVAGLATVAAACSWLVVRYAQEARSYALVLVLTSVAWLGLVAYLQATDDEDRRRWWALFAAATVLAPLAHGLAVLQLAGQVALLAMLPDRRAHLERLRGVLIALAVVGAVLVAAGASDVASWIPPMDAGQVGAVLTAFTAPGLVASGALWAVIAIGSVVCVRRRKALTDPTARALALLPVLWGLVPLALLFAASLVRPYLLARYVVGSAPGIGLLVAFAVVGSRPRLDPLRSAVVAVVAAAALVSAQLALHDEPGADWAGAADVVAADAGLGDAIVFPNPSVRAAFDYAWLAAQDPEAPDPISPVEPIDEVRRFYTVIDPAELPGAVGSSGRQRVWLVDQRGEGFAGANDAFIDHASVADTYRVADRRTLAGGVDVALLVQR